MPSSAANTARIASFAQTLTKKTTKASALKLLEETGVQPLLDVYNRELRKLWVSVSSHTLSIADPTYIAYQISHHTDRLRIVNSLHKMLLWHLESVGKAAEGTQEDGD